MSEYLKNRENANAEEVLEEYEFEVNGNLYTVKPIPFKRILKLEFSKDRLIVPHNEDNTAEMQLYNITNDKQRGKLNKWLKRLVTNSETEEPVDIDTIAAEEWKLSDVGRLLLFIIEISGLSPEGKKNDNKENEEETSDEEKKNEYMFLFSTLQKGGTMSKSEIMASSLPYLYGMAAEIQEDEIRKMSATGIGAFLGGGIAAPKEKGTTETVSSPEELLSFVNG